jgi:hypothetical protein
MRPFTGALIVLLYLAIPAQAQGLTGTVNHPAWGVTFTMPDGWVGQRSGEGYLFGSYTQRGIVLILPHEYSTPEALHAAAQKGLDDGFQTHLDVEGVVQPFGERGLAAALRGQVQGQPARAYIVSVLGPSGGGVTVLSAVEPAYYTESVAQRTEQIAQSIDFAAPAASSAPAESDWAVRLKGSRLTYLYSYYSGGASGDYVGASEKTVIDLCSAGHFFYSGSHSLAVDGGAGSGYNASGYGGARDQGHGQWAVIYQGGQPVLQLTFQSGAVTTYKIGYPSEELHLNGERFFWTTHSSPADYRPQCP